MIQHCCREFKLGLVIEIEAVDFTETFIQRAADRALVGQQCGRINGAVIDFVVVVTGVLPLALERNVPSAGKRCDGLVSSFW